MGLRRWVRRLERTAGHLYETLRTGDGRTVRYTHGEMLDALAASIRRRKHRLLPHVREADTYEGMPGLIRRLEESRARVEGDEDCP